MDEDKKTPEEFQFQFDVAEGFYENFSSFFPLQLARVNNNRSLPLSLKLQVLSDIEKKAMESPKPTNIQPKAPEKSKLAELFNKKVNVDRFFEDIHSGKIEINEEKTKCMMIADLSIGTPFIFLLNQDWVEKKRRELEEQEKKRLKRLYEEELRGLKDPYFHELLRRVRELDYWRKKTFLGEDFKEKRMKKFKRNMKKLFMKE